MLSLGQRDGAIVPIAHQGTIGTIAPSLCPKQGCALPLTKARLKPGEVVCDLGSGSGAEAIEAARLVGPGGFVYGLDIAPETLATARLAAAEAAIGNLEFIECFIEDIPLNDNTVDAIISNCALNLSKKRESVLAEAFRILKPGGRLLIADIVLLDTSLEQEVQQTITPVLGCLNGVLPYEEYPQLLAQCGFSAIETELFQQFTIDRLLSRAKKRLMHEAQAMLEHTEGAQRINGAFASVYLMARKP